MKPPAHLGGCVWTACHSFQCPGHSLALGPWLGRVRAQQKAASQERRTHKASQWQGRRELRRAGTRPQRAGRAEGGDGCQAGVEQGARAAGVGQGGLGPGRGGILGAELAGLRGDGCLWMSKPRGWAAHPLWARRLDRPCLGSGAPGRQPPLGKREARLPAPSPLCTLAPQPSSPGEPQSLLRPPSLGPPQPQATCLSPAPQPSPPPAPILAGTGARKPGSLGLGTPVCPGDQPAQNTASKAWLCPWPCQPGPEGGSAPGGRPCQLSGPYLHAVILLVSATLPTCRGVKVEA